MGVKKDRQVCARSTDKGTVQLNPEKTAQGVKRQEGVKKDRQGE
jgi:hypothetical protein